MPVVQLRRLGTGCTIALLVLRATTCLANPEGGIVAAGAADIRTTTGRVDITQYSDRAVIDWRSFDISTGEVTQFHQPSSSAIAVNRIHSSQASLIDGSLIANGNIVLINQNGVVIGNGATVDANSFVATTTDIDNSAVMQSGNALTFNKPSSNPDAAIINYGTISAKDSGLVGFVAPQVENHGVIQARLGKVAMAAGDTATIDFYGDGLLEIAMSDDVQHALVKNTGSIEADGGTITLTAATGSALLSSAIQVEGSLKAQAVDTHEGEIVIAALGRNAVENNSAEAKGDANHISTVTISGTLDVSGYGTDEKGGKITVTGDDVALASSAKLDASGDTGGGEIKIGGDYQGQGTTPTAKKLVVASGTSIKSDAAANGDGGKVILWSDGATGFKGSISAKGGSISGDGGFVEVSGKETLGYDGLVDLRADNGEWGTLLLDPTDLTISNAANSNVNGATPFNGTAGTSNLNVTTLQTALASANVSVLSSGGSGGLGDITVADAISWNSTRTLTLTASNNLNVNAAITNAGTGSISLNANVASTGDVNINANVTTAGDVNAYAGRDINLAAGNTLTTGASGGLGLYAANNNINGTGRINFDGNAAVGTGNIAMVSGTNGTRSDITFNSTNLTQTGATFGDISLNGFQDITIDRSITSNNSISLRAYRDLNINSGVTLTNGATRSMFLYAASDYILNTGNLNMNGILNVGSGTLYMISGVNGTRPDLTLDSTNFTAQSGTFGNITLLGFQDITIDRDITYSGNMDIRAYRDLNVNSGRTISTTGSGNFILSAANDAAGGTGNLNMDGILRPGTGRVTLTSGINGTRPNLTLDSSNFIPNGATIGELMIQGFQDLTIDRNITSTGNITMRAFRDLTINSSRTIQNGATSNMTLYAADNNSGGTGNFYMNGVLNLGSGSVSLTSGSNGTRPDLTINGTNWLTQGATTGTISITGFQDTVIDRNLTSSGNINVVSFRDLTLNSSRTVTTGATGGLSLQAANNNGAGTGNLNINGIMSVGTGFFNLTSGINGTRPDLTLNTTNLIRQGATFGNTTIQGILNLTLDRILNSTIVVTLNNTLNILRNDISGTQLSLNTTRVDEGANVTLTGSNTVGIGTLTGTAGGATESLTVSTPTNTLTMGLANGLSVTANAATFTHNQAWGGTTAMGDVNITTTNSYTPHSITASTISMRTTGATSDITLNAGRTWTASGTGTPLIVAAGRDLINNAGAGAFNLTGGGSPRWLVFSGDTANATITKGSLSGFNRYGCTYNAGSPSCASGTDIPATGNGFYFAYAPTVTISGITADDKVYDGTTAAALSGTGSISGLVNGDSLTLDASGATASFANKTVGTNKTVTASGYVLSSDWGYIVSQPSSLTANITQRNLTISATANDKVFDGTANATVTLSDNRVAGDTLTTGYGTALFDTAAEGTNKTVNVSGITLGGADSGNYTFNTTAVSFADITASGGGGSSNSSQNSASEIASIYTKTSQVPWVIYETLVSDNGRVETEEPEDLFSVTTESSAAKLGWSNHSSPHHTPLVEYDPTLWMLPESNI